MVLTELVCSQVSQWRIRRFITHEVQVPNAHDAGNEPRIHCSLLSIDHEHPVSVLEHPLPHRGPFQGATEYVNAAV